MVAAELTRPSLRYPRSWPDRVAPPADQPQPVGLIKSIEPEYCVLANHLGPDVVHARCGGVLLRVALLCVAKSGVKKKQ